MSDRYTKRFSLNSMLYAEGAPLVIAAGALLSDSFTHSMLVQLKFISISDQPISTVKVSVTAMDAKGESQWAPVEYQYTDVKARRDESFGSKAAIIMPGTAVRSFSVKVTEVNFKDGSTWKGEDSLWQEHSRPKTLDAAFGDKELSHQFAIRYGNDCEYLPEEDGKLWYCVCGAINTMDEPKCHRCRRVYSALKAINIASIRSETAQRMESERRADDEQQAELSKKRSLALRLSIILVPILAVFIILIATVPGYLAQKNSYADASALLYAGKYDAAQAAFAALGDYGDSREQAEQNVPYKKAMYIMDCAKAGDVAGLLVLDMRRSDLADDESISVALYKQAAEMFLALGEYKDSAAQRETALAAVTSYYDAKNQEAYNSALTMLEERRFLEARDAFLALDDYYDSEEMALEAMYQRAVLLYELTEKYMMQGVSASISDTAGVKSVFYITQSAFTSLGKDISSDIRDICREDGVEINIMDAPAEGEFTPVCQAVNQLFTDLDGYKDCADYAVLALEAGDFTKPFYDYCASGQLYEAMVWLSEYKEPFEYKEQWLSLLQSYLPYCGSWELDMGDPSLIPMTVGAEMQCNAFSSVVTIKDSIIKLMIYVNGAEDYPIVLNPRVGSSGFEICNDGISTFVAIISNKGLFQYSRYINSGLQAGTFSCEYYRTN